MVRESSLDSLIIEFFGFRSVDRPSTLWRVYFSSSSNSARLEYGFDIQKLTNLLGGRVQFLIRSVGLGMDPFLLPSKGTISRRRSVLVLLQAEIPSEFLLEIWFGQIKLEFHSGLITDNDCMLKVNP